LVAGSSSIAKKKKKKKRKKKKKKTPDPRAQEKIDRLDAWLAKGKHLSRHHARNSTLLLDAAEVGHVTAALALLEKPGIRILKEIDAPPLDAVAAAAGGKYTALHFAALYGHVEIVDILLARPETQIDRRIGGIVDGRTPLSLSSARGHAKVVKSLLAAGADQNKPDHDWITPLFISSLHGHAEVVNLLCSDQNGFGADYVATKTGLTPLFVSSEGGHARVVKLLLAAFLLPFFA
jgi:ankyrin repeat protein